MPYPTKNNKQEFFLGQCLMVAPKKGLKGVFLKEATKKQYPEQEKDVNEKRPKAGHKKYYFPKNE